MKINSANLDKAKLSIFMSIFMERLRNDQDNNDDDSTWDEITENTSDGVEAITDKWLAKRYIEIDETSTSELPAFGRNIEI